ncbi:MAG TPA: PqqD family protein, partial [Pirellulaceae bacterium]|nr:PqqD family protein [Pirellulaceae bacterium]
MLDLPTNERPLPLRRRPDIATRLRSTRRGREWICKDPVRRRYYSLSEIEHALWQMLDGQVSLAQIKQRFAREFAPRQLETGQFVMFLARLFRQELIIST